jgi:N-acetylmuramoyl-L-alanine amidase
MKVMKKNSSGKAVTDLQRRLKLLDFDLGVTGVDGIFGERTVDAVKRFQQDRGLRASGIVDQETWQELVDAGYKIGDRLLYLKNPPFRGDDVKTLQLWLKTLGFYPDNENGIFSQKTQKALIEFQENMDIHDDGIMGEQTLKHLRGLQRIITEKKTSNFPYIKKSREEGKHTAGTVIFDLDPIVQSAEAGKPKDSSEPSREGIAICAGIIDYCRKILEGSGYSTVLSSGNNKTGSASLFDRVKHANSSGSELLVSIGLNYSSEKEANGCSCYYFKGLKSYSIGGFQLANSIQDRLVKDMDILDCRVHGANYAILKNTEMVSVVVEPAFISNRQQKKDLHQIKYQKKISKNICGAITQFLKER